MHELFVCMFSFCMSMMLNLTYLIRCRLRFVSDCVFFYKLNAYCIFYPAVTGELMSARQSLLGAIVATVIFCPSLLSYHCSDGPVVRGHSDLQLVVTVPDHGSVWLRLCLRLPATHTSFSFFVTPPPPPGACSWLRWYHCCLTALPRWARPPPPPYSMPGGDDFPNNATTLTWDAMALVTHSSCFVIIFLCRPSPLHPTPPPLLPPSFSTTAVLANPILTKAAILLLVMPTKQGSQHVQLELLRPLIKIRLNKVGGVGSLCFTL
jgi:hypothetical protein